jgi:hypothetical protein
VSEAEAVQARADLVRTVANAKARLAMLDAGELSLGLSPAELTSERQNLEAWLAKAEDLEARIVGRRGKGVAQAVKDAGGAENVAQGIRQAKLVAGGWFQSDPEFSRLRELGGQLSEVDRQLGLIGECNYFPTNSLGERLVNDQTQLRGTIDALRSDIDSRLMQRTHNLVKRATGGDAESLAELRSTVASRPDAFPPQLAPALETAAVVSGLMLEARGLAQQQDQRDARIRLESKARVLLRTIGWSRVHAVQALLRQAVAGDRHATHALVTVAHNVEGVGGGRQPVVSPVAERQIALKLLSLIS